MSSRVLPGAGPTPAEAMVWRRVAQPRNCAPAGETRSEDLADELRARIAELERQAPRREETAHQDGFRKGQAAGEEKAAARLDSVVARFAQTIEELAGQRLLLRREAEADVVNLALAIARRILNRELSTDPEALLGVVKAALGRLEAREIDRVRVHPADAPLVKQHLERLGLPQKIEVAADAALERGAAVFETSRGQLDASVETQLQEIQRGLADRLDRR